MTSKPAVVIQMPVGSEKARAQSAAFGQSAAARPTLINANTAYVSFIRSSNEKEISHSRVP